MNSTFCGGLIELGISTPDGKFVARYSETGLAQLDFPEIRRHRTARRNESVPALVRRWHALVTAALQRALAGKAPGALPPLDLKRGTVFQRSVWQAMRQIGAGQTRSYGEIACALGKPGATRAVGGACGANPIPVFIPCHRVMATGGKIGGFSCGVKWKLALLDREGVVVKA